MVVSAVDDVLVVNGVDVRTGTYLIPPMRVSEVARSLRRSAGLVDDVSTLRRRAHEAEAHLGLAYGYRPEDLASAGWGLVVPPGLRPGVLEALEPLLRLRQEQAGDRFRVLRVEQGETKDGFLARHGMGPSVSDPRKVPYYLMLLGTPEHISFEFQYQLGVSYGVGRLDLPSAEAFAHYAATVLAAESRPSDGRDGRDGSGTHLLRDAGTQAGPGLTRHRTLQIFAPRHVGDVATQLSASQLVEPLASDLREATAAWQVSTDVGPAATRERLHTLLTDPDGPDLLFTAGHGVGDPGSGPRDVSGALLCQDWAGPEYAGPLTEAHYLAAAHLATGTPVRPRVVFAFACFGAGTPQLSDYPGAAPDRTLELADCSFTAHLPQRLLSEPSGGALAFVGHIDRAWSCSFLWPGSGEQVAPFSSTVLALMDGARLGFAMESMSARYAEIATELTTLLESHRKYGKRVSDAYLVGLWTALHDARGWVVLGDPAVRVAPHGSAGLTGR